MNDTFRTDRDMSDANEHDTILDRAWAATQPPDLSTAEADRIWAEVLHACDHPSTLTMDSPARSRSRRFKAVALVGFAMAQAAAIVLAVLLTVQPDPKHAMQLAKFVPKPATTIEPVVTHDVEPYETFMLVLNAEGSFVREERNKPSDSGSALVYADLPVNNGSDAFARLETISP